jgi:oxygen-dependent protoporphyrinogen oxidase
MSATPHVAVVGGGITGLVAAHRLDRLGLRVTLVESDLRLGGKIRTEQFAGRPLDTGAEALLARAPETLSLCRDLGLEGELIAPARDRAFVWAGGRLRPLPPRLLAGVPDGAGAVISAGILSPLGLARAALDLLLPSRAPGDDVSIGELVRGRLGSEVLERLIDPLLGGIHAGSCDQLSLRATAPHLEAAVGSGRGLVRGLRSATNGTAPAGPALLSLRGGLEGLVIELLARLEAAGAEVRTGSTVDALEALPDGRVRLPVDGDRPILADRVVLAAPAFAAAELLSECCPSAARELRQIDYASVATVLLAYPSGALARATDGSGFLVPRTEGRTVTACTWSSLKWPQADTEQVLLKASVGRAGDERALELSDAELVERVQTELGEAMGMRTAASEARVVRFTRALPQYRVGHLDRITRIDAAMAALPAVQLAGAAYRGVGVAACIRDGQRAADRVAASIPLQNPPRRHQSHIEPFIQLD